MRFAVPRVVCQKEVDGMVTRIDLAEQVTALVTATLPLDHVSAAFTQAPSQISDCYPSNLDQLLV